MERSLAFTALLESDHFRQMEARAGDAEVTRFLADYHASGSRDMWTFGREWTAREYSRQASTGTDNEMEAGA